MAKVHTLLFTCCMIFQPYDFVKTPLHEYIYGDKLRQALLHNYDVHSRPAQYYNTTTVNFSLVVKHADIDELKSILILHAWIYMEWTDEKLKWNSSDYGGLNEIRILDHELWLPDIYVFDSPSESTGIHSSNIYAIISSNGDVLWTPPMQINVVCNLNLKYWPFDTQHCNITFASWSHSGDAIDIQVGSRGMQLSFNVNNTEWQVTHTVLEKRTYYYVCCPQSYPKIVAQLVLKRVAPSYNNLIITPAFVIVIFTLTSFWLQTHTNEKIVLNMCTLFIIGLLMFYYIQKLPPMGTNTPSIILFYNSCLYVALFSLIEAMVVIWLIRTRHSSSLWIVKKFINGRFGRILRLNTCIVTTTRSHEVEEMRDHHLIEHEEHDAEHQLERRAIQQDWILLATAIDRVAFCFCTAVFIILIITYSS